LIEKTLVDALILAGAASEVEMDPENKYKNRAMIPINGKSMLDWVASALKASSGIGKIAAIGNVQSEYIDEVIPPKESLVENIRFGSESFPDSEYILVVCSDIPMLSKESIDDFIEKAIESKSDLAYPIIEKTDCLNKYPEMQRTYLTTADGIFTGGNMVLFSKSFIEDNWHIISQAYNARKHPIQLARLIGMDIFIKVAVGKLFPSVLLISDLEESISKMISAKVKAIVSKYPEIGEDIDKASDMEAAKKYLI
jgi:GTP:adenosylcobinamide-phosphate guanylyltransferase